jgi:hypothetical protein
LFQQVSEDENGTEHLIAHSNCCGAPNRNIAKFWMYVVKKGILESVNHKLLEPGYTYMECSMAFVAKQKHTTH